MPLLSTFSANSAQGYGFGVGAAGVLTTYTFPSGTSTWTAPTGVTNLVSAVGQGQDGTAPFWSDYSPNVFIGEECSGSNISTTLAWSTVLSELDTLFAAANSITTNPAGQTATLQWLDAYLWCSATGYWRQGSQFSSTGLWRRIGTLSQNYGYTGNVTPGTNGNYGPTSGSMQLYLSGGTGASTTGFSLTFPGGTPSATTAPTTTFNNVAVTPGTTYTINNNQSLVITYFA